MNKYPPKQTRWPHPTTDFDHGSLEDMFGPGDGFFPVRATLDPDVGEEVVLYLRDQTPFVEVLASLNPFRLRLNVGTGITAFGALCWLVFWIPPPAKRTSLLSGYQLIMNPHSDVTMSIFRQLAAQSHWHLFLVGEHDEQHGFYEFRNNFRLNDSLNTALMECAAVQFISFDRAKREFLRSHTIEELLSGP